METALVGAGFMTLNLDYASRRKPFGRSAGGGISTETA
jgi:hypothetical protein